MSISRRGDLVSKEVADDFVDALRMLEDRDVKGLVRIHAEDCEVGNVSISETLRSHEFSSTTAGFVSG